MTAPIDFGAVIASHSACGVKLDYAELDFMQVRDGKVVMFDAYAVAHKYAPLDIECGVICFPFFMTCRTDDGERVAYGGLRFSDEPAAEFTPIIGTNDFGRLAVDADAAAVPVSSGVCCFSDAEAYDAYAAHLKDAVHPLSGLIVLNGMTHETVELFGNKYAVMSTGWGDGRYKCYKGKGKSGNVVAVIVDFGLIEYPAAAGDEMADIEIDTDDVFVYDPDKSESENNVARWTQELSAETDNAARLNAYSRRGYAYHSLNNTDAALADYNSAIELCKKVKDRPTLLRAWSVYDNAAEIYVQRSDYESAIALMESALAVGDNFYTGAYLRLIDLYQLTKRTDRAVEVAEKLLKKRPDDPVACMKYAEACVAAMDYARAAETYGRLATHFRLYENLFDEAACFIELGELGKADEALERHPSKEYNEQYWYYKAYIAYKKRRYSDALEKAEKAHGIDAEYMPALYLLIDIHSIMQSYHAVARYAEAYKKLRPDKEYGYCVCAEAHMILGNYSECFKNYEYLYSAIKPDDKYAALAAITAARTGDNGRKNKLLKILRRKHSEYYAGAVYAVYTTMSRHKRYPELSKVVYKLGADDDFLLQLAVYLAGNDGVLPATYILDLMFKRNSLSFEIVAQQVRIAVRLGDKKLFDELFSYYVEHYAGDVTDADKALIAERFESVGSMRRVDWNALRSNVAPQLSEPRLRLNESKRGAVTSDSPQDPDASKATKDKGHTTK